MKNNLQTIKPLTTLLLLLLVVTFFIFSCSKEPNQVHIETANIVFVNKDDKQVQIFQRSINVKLIDDFVLITGTNFELFIHKNKMISISNMAY